MQLNVILTSRVLFLRTVRLYLYIYEIEKWKHWKRIQSSMYEDNKAHEYVIEL